MSVRSKSKLACILLAGIMFLLGITLAISGALVFATLSIMAGWVTAGIGEIVGYKRRK
jgi:Na+-transporting methylmalonyl-CoA/oxaloacetate decarboxylase gamma subunit